MQPRALALAHLAQGHRGLVLPRALVPEPPEWVLRRATGVALSTELAFGKYANREDNLTAIVEERAKTSLVQP